MKQPRQAKKNSGQNLKAVLLQVMRFSVRHGEKVIAGILLAVAVFIGLKFKDFKSLSWRPNELTQLAETTEEIIRSNEFTPDEQGIVLFNYAAYADQIRSVVPHEPYRSALDWFHAVHPALPLRSGFEVLTADSLRGTSVRKLGLLQPPTPEQSEQWEHTLSPNASIWINLYGTIPLWSQWHIYNQRSGSIAPLEKLDYQYYEIEKAAFELNAELDWQPISVGLVQEFQADLHYEFSLDQLIPLGHPSAGTKPTGQTTEQPVLEDRHLLLFTDYDIEPARTYAYRVRLYLVNPNYHLQETSAEEGVDVINELVRSDWSLPIMVYVPPRTLLQLQSVIPTDPTEFPRQSNPLGTVRGNLLLDYYDLELGQSFPLVEKSRVVRGSLGNLSKEEVNRTIIRTKGAEAANSLNYPDEGLITDACVMDFSGGRKLQKRLTREAQASPDLFVAGKALVLMPDGSMQVLSTE